jgi:hypothetical protein
MSTRGTHVAILIAIAIAFFLPKRVECGYPGASCGRAGKWRTICTAYEVEPIGFYALELVAKRDVGFAYSVESECR